MMSSQPGVRILVSSLKTNSHSPLTLTGEEIIVMMQSWIPVALRGYMKNDIQFLRGENSVLIIRIRRDQNLYRIRVYCQPAEAFHCKP